MRLENRRTLTGTGGSNPSSSAKSLVIVMIARLFLWGEAYFCFESCFSLFCTGLLVFGTDLCVFLCTPIYTPLLFGHTRKEDGAGPNIETGFGF